MIGAVREGADLEVVETLRLRVAVEQNVLAAPAAGPAAVDRVLSAPPEAVVVIVRAIRKRH